MCQLHKISTQSVVFYCAEHRRISETCQNYQNTVFHWPPIQCLDIQGVFPGVKIGAIADPVQRLRANCWNLRSHVVFRLRIWSIGMDQIARDVYSRKNTLYTNGHFFFCASFLEAQLSQRILFYRWTSSNSYFTKLPFFQQRAVFPTLIQRRPEAYCHFQKHQLQWWYRSDVIYKRGLSCPIWVLRELPLHYAIFADEALSHTERRSSS